jgi:hypothetical protein
MPLTAQQIDRALERIEPGPDKYLWIMDRVHHGDVRTDAVFSARTRGSTGFAKLRSGGLNFDSGWPQGGVRLRVVRPGRA